MEQNSLIYRTYVQILERELVPAMGCTEPICVAYCAAKARETLGAQPDRVSIEASGNIIKNVKSVIVPNTGGRRGLEAAAAAGIVYGDATRQLEVISSVSSEQLEALGHFLQEIPIEVRPADSDLVLDLSVQVFHGTDRARVRITHHHTGITQITRNGTVLFEDTPTQTSEETDLDHSLLSIADIYDFAQSLNPEDVTAVLDRQISYNTAISQEGLRNDYGANIGKVILRANTDLRSRAKAKAAAGSDARMSGCELPVIINSGSGNQGITVSIPILEYYNEYRYRYPKDLLYRTLALANLTALHLKQGIGRLSAYCGAVSAGASAGAGIAYLQGGDLDAVSHTLVNALAITSGMICDGAKPSCAAKIAAAVDAALLAYDMYQNGQQFYHGDGLVVKGVENTIRSVSEVGRDGMRETDRKIIELMTRC